MFLDDESADQNSHQQRQSAQHPSAQVLASSPPLCCRVVPKNLGKAILQTIRGENKEGQSLRLQPFQTHLHNPQENQWLCPLLHLCPASSHANWREDILMGTADRGSRIDNIDRLYLITFRPQRKEPFCWWPNLHPNRADSQRVFSTTEGEKKKLPSHVKWWCDSWTCDFGSWGFQINKVFFPLHALHFAHWLLHI